MNWKNFSRLLLPGLLLAAAPAWAGFAAFVSPPRHELKAQPGETARESVLIRNDSAQAGELEVKTADWDLNAQGGLEFHESDTLAADSCRPWVRIERRTLSLPPNGQKKYRFEVQVPAGAGAGECRFALLFSEAPESLETPGEGIGFPVSGRIAVIVYVAIGGARPEIEVKSLELRQIDGKPVLVLAVANRGTAHGRLDGVLQAEDAAGRRAELSVPGGPLLPGRGRELLLQPHSAGNAPLPDLQPPLKLTGFVEWDGGHYPVDAVLGGR